MVDVRPWSFSSLDTFLGCPRKFHETRILKKYKEEETEAQRLGTEMHKHFEDRLSLGKPLPAFMAQHEGLMQEVRDDGGIIQCEQKVGLNLKLQPVDFFAKDVWWRGVLDVHQRHPNGHARVLDYKTGKPHQKMMQLHLFSIFSMICGSTQVQSQFYWTQSKTFTSVTLPAAQLPYLLETLVEPLSEYREAHRLDIWPPKKNHLCRSYCPVVDCEHWGKGMNQR